MLTSPSSCWSCRPRSPNRRHRSARSSRRRSPAAGHREARRHRRRDRGNGRLFGCPRRVALGRELVDLDDKRLTNLRRDKVGFVFQSFNLLPVLDARENIVLPMSIAGRKPDEEWLNRLIDTVGLDVAAGVAAGIKESGDLDLALVATAAGEASAADGLRGVVETDRAEDVVAGPRRPRTRPISHEGSFGKPSASPRRIASIRCDGSSLSGSGLSFRARRG